NVVRLVIARPRRHRNTHRSKRFGAERPELKMRSQWNRQAGPSFDHHGFLARTLFAPHLSASAQEEPDFFYRSMGDRLRCRAGRQLKGGHPAGPQTQQQADVGTVRCDRIASFPKLLRQEFWSHGVRHTDASLLIICTAATSTLRYKSIANSRASVPVAELTK